MISADITAIRDVPSLQGAVSPAEWKVRVDLAAMHHLAHRMGWNSGISNHAAARVPGEPGCFLLKPDQLLWNEVTASNLIKVDLTREWYESDGVNRPGYVLHSTILRARPDVEATLHLHTESHVAVGGLKGGLRPLSRDAIRFMNRIGYHDYTGLPDGPEERALIVEALGRNIALLMRGHGSVVVGASVPETFRLMCEFASACEVQLRMMATGDALIEPPAEILDRMSARSAPKPRNTGEPERAEIEWAGWLRTLDADGATYRQ